MMKLKQLLYGCLVILALQATGCKDDWDLNGGQMVEGDAQLSITVAFNQENTEIGTRATKTPTGGDEGDLMDNIKTLYLVVYNQDGKLHGRYPVYGADITIHEDVDNVKYELTDNRTEDEKGLQNDATGKVTFDLKLSSGYYYIYAVANVGDFENKDISTREKLKALEFTWDQTTTSNNSQMFGIFTFESNRNATDDEPLAISATTTKLHCWVRRLASKVTVAFDGSDLYDNVQIYITNIAIKDIPRKCMLGNDNTPGPEPGNEGNEIENRKNRHDESSQPHGVIETGKSIQIQTLPEDKASVIPDNYLHICNDKHPYLGIDQDKGSIDNAHGHKALSLFFYENMQGTGKNKAQSKDGNKIDFPNPDMEAEGTGWKDEMAYGTYIEVEGFYRCPSNSSRLGYGPIKFRYMLGQKPEEGKPDDNYDAKRNTHYKLTLKFKGYGNDADWHIDYEEHPGIYITSPQYISYLYNKSMMATVKIVGEIEPGTTLHAEIVGTTSETNGDRANETFWRPWGNGTEEYPDPKEASNPGSEGGDYYWKGEVHVDGPWNSFLSLRKTELLVISDGTDDVASNATNKKYFIDKKKGTREYAIEQGPHESDDLYRVEYTKNIENSVKERIFYIPLYTRAKVLFVRTGYSGNNPYVAYPRKAKIKFWANIKNPETGNYEKQETYLEIIQVRRIVNPKGIWRDEHNAQSKPFHVRLLRLPNEEEDFVSFDSQGGWCADVVQGEDNIISLSTTKEGSGINALPQHGVTHIEGATEHPIDFTINFNGNKGYAIVRVKYHNYTCEHDIFCSVGNDPVKLTNHNLWWNTRNVYRFDNNNTPILTGTPIEEGSLFRRTNYTAILASNNETYGLGIKPDNLKVIENNSTTPTNKKWADLKPTGTTYNSWSIAGNEERIATIEDFYTLVPQDPNDMTFPIKQAYGVLYGDGANKVEYKRTDAYGYMREDGTNSSKGMQGCFVYNKNTCKHIFLPISASGHGHRKHEKAYKSEDPSGTLRYASRSRRFDLQDPETIIYQPLFYDLYRRPGAIYWCRNRLNGGNRSGKESSAFDINFFTMSFGGYGNDAAISDNGSDSHACFIRTVRYKAPN